jgi:hypothetical protein
MDLFSYLVTKTTVPQTVAFTKKMALVQAEGNDQDPAQ